jgi:hypothetical protein
VFFDSSESPVHGAQEQSAYNGHFESVCYHPLFVFNSVRLLLGVIAYNLGNLVRRLVLPVTIQNWSLTSLQQRLFKTESHLTGSLFRQILRRIEGLRYHPT